MPLLSTLQLQRDNPRKCHTQKGLTETLLAKTSKVGTTIKIRGAIQKPRGQQRVGRWSKICHFCPRLVHKEYLLR